MKDHIHMLLMIPPKFSVVNTIGFLKGKSAIRVFREYLSVKRNFTGRHFWARGYCVSTVGLDEGVIREYIKTQELFDMYRDSGTIVVPDQSLYAVGSAPPQPDSPPDFQAAIGSVKTTDVLVVTINDVNLVGRAVN